MELQLLALLTIAATEAVLRLGFGGGPTGWARVGVHAAVLVATIGAIQAWAFFADRRFRREMQRVRDDDTQPS